MLGQDFIVFDLETTGVQAGVDEIIEIGAIKVLNGAVAERYQQLIKPRAQLPLTVQRLTGIQPADLMDQPYIDDILDQFLQFVDCLPVAAHNANFDLGFMAVALGRPLSESWLDTLGLARICFPLAPNHRLGTLSEYLKLEGSRFHRALNDAEITAKLLLCCLEKARNWDLPLLRQLNMVLPSGVVGTIPLFNQLEQNMMKRFPDRLIRESVLCLADVEEGLFSRKKNQDQPKLPEEDQIAAILGREGPFAGNIANYQYRPGQIAMLRSVVKAFHSHEHLVAEAGTGTGKSLAYLVPAVFWATGSKEKVVVATHTINLQEQLWEKDVPLLRRLLPVEFEAALVKGRNNYLCLRKWQAVWADMVEVEAEARSYLAVILTWLSETRTGDKSELNLGRGSQEVWSRLAADSDSCLGSRCRFYSNGCFVMRARRKAENADLLIVNHSLLLSDAKTDNMVLPDYNYLVVDEAHHLEDSATEHLGQTVSDKGMERFLKLLRTNGTPPGILGQIKHRLPGLQGVVDESGLEKLSELQQQAVELLGLLSDSSTDYFAGLLAVVQSLGSAENGTAQARLKDTVLNWPGWPALNAARDNLSLRLGTMAEILTSITQILAENEHEDTAGLMRDINSFAMQCKEQSETVWQLLDLAEPNKVVWVEMDNFALRLRSAPVEVGPLLREMFFTKLKSVVLTSATLSVNNNFEHYIARVGLEPETQCIQVESPFNYENQAMICIPRDLPDPSRVAEQEYVTAVAQLLVDLVRTVQGRTLVLFTSHRMLKQVYYEIKPYLEAEEIQVMGHNLDGNRGKLVEEFKSNPRAVLLGASSFWEGVDIQGDTLSCVVIIKLPFWPPTMPTVEARMEVLAKQNQDAFRVLAIPQAVIRLKQGFGRLIRTQEDKGAVVILDKRILDRSYGRKFLNSLPLKTHIRGDSDLVLRKINQWLDPEHSVPTLKLVSDASEVDRALPNGV